MIEKAEMSPWDSVRAEIAALLVDEKATPKGKEGRLNVAAVEGLYDKVKAALAGEWCVLITDYDGIFASISLIEMHTVARLGEMGAFIDDGAVQSAIEQYRADKIAKKARAAIDRAKEAERVREND